MTKEKIALFLYVSLSVIYIIYIAYDYFQSRRLLKTYQEYILSLSNDVKERENIIKKLLEKIPEEELSDAYKKHIKFILNKGIDS